MEKSELEQTKEEFLKLVLEASNFFFIRIYLFDNKKNPYFSNYWTSSIYEIIKNTKMAVNPPKEETEKKEKRYARIMAIEKSFSEINIDNEKERSKFLLSLAPIFLFEAGDVTTDAGDQKTDRVFDASHIIPSDYMNALILGAGIIDFWTVKKKENEEIKEENLNEKVEKYIEEIKSEKEGGELTGLGRILKNIAKQTQRMGTDATMWEDLFTYKSPLFFAGADEASYSLNFNLHVIGLVSIKTDGTYEIINYEKIYEKIKDMERAKRFYIYLYRFACQNYIRMPFRMFQKFMMSPTRIKAEVGFRIIDNKWGGNLKLLGCISGLGRVSFQDQPSDFHTFPMSYYINIGLREVQYGIIGELGETDLEPIKERKPAPHPITSEIITTKNVSEKKNEPIKEVLNLRYGGP